MTSPKRPQINIPVKPHEAEIVKDAHLILMNRDDVVYTKKDAILLILAEFIKDNYRLAEKKSA